jgi:hypothetical protein
MNPCHAAVRCFSVAALLLALLVAPRPADANPPPVPQEEPSQVQATQPAPTLEPAGDGFRKYWLMIGIPGMILGAGLFVAVVVLANRARRGKLERGELPEMPR